MSGREDNEWLRAARRQAESGESLFLEGVARSGKTSLLLDLAAQALSKLAPENYWAPVLLLTPDRRRAAQLDRRLSQMVAARHGTLGPLGGFETHRPVRSVVSYAHLIVRLWSLERAEPTASAPFVSGAAEDVWVADYLERNGDRWQSLFDSRVLESPALRMRLRNIIARSGEAGLTPEDLEWLGRDLKKDLWVVAADVYREFAGPGNQPFSPQTPNADAARLPRIAADLLANWGHLGPAVGVSSPPPVPALLLVDDAQDLPASAGLLVTEAARAASQVVVTASPTSAAAVFRGGNPRQGELIAKKIGLSTVSLLEDLRDPVGLRQVAETVQGWIDPVKVSPTERGGTHPSVSVSVSATESSRARAVAGYLRQQHLFESVPWEQMAVIVRTSSDLEPIRRQLARLDIPLQAADRPVNLAEIPVCAALLQLLELGVQQDTDGSARSPSELQEAALDLVTSPLVRADSLELFRLTRDLGSILGRPLSVLDLLELPPGELGRAGSASGARQRVIERVEAAASLWEAKGAASKQVPEEGLWTLWELAGLQDSLVELALHQDPAFAAVRSQVGHETLDAVIALFRRADLWSQKLQDVPGAQTSAGAFATDLLNQQIASDSLAATGAAEVGVQVLTASSAAGQSWQVVCIAGPQLGEWPASGRDSVGATRALQQIGLAAAEAGWPGETPIAPYLPGNYGGEVRSFSERQDDTRRDEARLFSLAVTRAQKSLNFAVVASADASPSIFLHALADAGIIAPLEDGDGNAIYSGLQGTPALQDLIARARAQAGDPQGSAESRGDAVTLLALLAAEGVDEANPQQWDVTGSVSSDSPIIDAGPLRLSPSKLQQAMECPLRWFLSSVGLSDQDVSEGPVEVTGSFIGTLVHQIAEENPYGSKEQLLEALQAKWDQWELERETFWGRKLWDDLVDMMDSLALHFASVKGKVATEFSFAFEAGPAVVSGRADRLETLPDGEVRVVDIKTGSSLATVKLLPENPQLLAYQLAVRAEGYRSGGAALLELRRTKKNQLGRQDPLDDEKAEERTQELVDLAEGLSGNAYPAVVGPWCRYCEFKKVCPAQDESARGTE